jgi:ParB-like chromosome segregation protein Spo0J
MRFQDQGKRGVLQNIDPRTILEEPGWNQRQDTPALTAHIQSLAQSIRAIGVLEPLTVYIKGEEIRLVNGHCRLAAVKILLAEGQEILTVPARVEAQTANDADRVLSMVTRNSGKPLEPIEVAAVFKRLEAFGWDVHAISAKSGYSENRVLELLRLNAAPEVVKEMIHKGEVSASTAAKVISQHGAEKATPILVQAVKTAKADGKTKASGKHLPPKPAKKPVTPLLTLAVTQEAEEAILEEAWNRFKSHHSDQFSPTMMAAFKASILGRS